jgi:C1A family cysteine protease
MRATLKHTRKYGWRHSLPDQRDMLFSAPLHLAIPQKVDLSGKCSLIEDQGDLGSCTAHALGCCLEFITGNKDLSRLFIYWNERYLEGNVNNDVGATMRTGAKVCAKFGSSLESLWPYNVKRFAAKPTKAVFSEALKHKAIQYFALYGIQSMKVALSQGYPFGIGISVYESFNSGKVATTGKVPMPKTNESLLGGHAVAIVGYDETKQMFKARNSWGISWGLKGYFWIPYAYLGNSQLASDAWCLR